MAQRPSEKPDWIPNDTTGITPPNSIKRAAGWVLEKPPFQYYNWFWNLLSQWTDFHGSQAEEWIVIDSDTDERDYATLAAYIADAPAAGDKVLIKGDQTVTVQTIIPSGITLKFLDGASLLCATDIATSVLKLNSDIVIDGVLNVVLSHTGVTALAVEFDGDNVKGDIDIENSSTGTLTLAAQINASKTGNKVDGFISNTGGGTLSGYLTDNSSEDSNDITFVDSVNNVMKRSRGANTLFSGFKFSLGSDADGDTYYRNSGILQRLAKGTNGEQLTLAAGLPSWFRTLATAAEVKTGTDATRAPSVAAMVSHEGVAKAWINFDGTGTIAIRDSYNVSSISDVGTGNYTVNWDTDFAAADYAIAGLQSNTNNGITIYIEQSTIAVGSVSVITTQPTVGDRDCDIVCLIAYGDQ